MRLRVILFFLSLLFIAAGLSPGAAENVDLPTFVPADALAHEGDLVGKVIKEGQVETEALAQLEGYGKCRTERDG